MLNLNHPASEFSNRELKSLMNKLIEEVEAMVDSPTFNEFHPDLVSRLSRLDELEVEGKKRIKRAQEKA